MRHFLLQTLWTILVATVVALVVSAAWNYRPDPPAVPPIEPQQPAVASE